MTPKRGRGKSLASYIDSDVPYSSRAGMPRADGFARDVHSGTDVCRKLYAPQLLKHLLGLARASVKVKWALRYVYFAASGPQAAAHDEELVRFAERLSGDAGTSGRSHTRRSWQRWQATGPLTTTISTTCATNTGASGHFPRAVCWRGS